MSRKLLATAPLALAILLAPALTPFPASAQTAIVADKAAAPRGFTARDMVTLDRLSDPRLSPDGKHVLYSLRSVDYDANKSATSLWLLDLNDSSHAARRLPASDGGASAGRWSPDGKGIYFLSRRSGSAQVWRTDVAGGAATQVTALPLDVGSFVLAPDGHRLVVSQAVYPGSETGDKPVKAAGQEKTTGVVYDKLFVRHWDEWADGTRNHLFALSLDAAGVATGAPLPLMRGFDGDAPGKPFGDDDDIAISPDGGSVVFSARLAGTAESSSTNFDLWQVPIDGSAAPRNLTADNKAMDSGPVFSPDGHHLAWRAMKRPTFEADRYAIMVRDLKTGAVREVDPAWDRSAAKIAWAADGRTLYATAEDVGQTRLFAVTAATGAVRPLTGEGHVEAFDVTAKGTVVYAASTLAAPSQLFQLESNGAAVQLTNVDADKLAGIVMGGYEQFSFPGWNGETVHGYVVKPANYQPGQKYPVAFLIHGGPQGSFGNLFHYRWNAQVYAGAGYGVVMIDFHGSTGYGQAFTDAISQHWGDRPLEDLQKGWAAALAKYPFLDGDRACALGGSYGGFMINWIAGNWNGPWKCLVNHDGVFDNRAMGYSTDELWFSEWENGGTPWANPAGYERYNPATHVDQWTKPELVVQGGQDFRIPLEQGLGTFTALQRKGVASQFLYFPDENHWVLKPQNGVQWHDVVLAWLNKWTVPQQP